MRSKLNNENKTPEKYPLPKDIKASDLKYPKWNGKDPACGREGHDYQDHQFDLWWSERFGWCIPTLQISSGRHRYRPASDTARTYAVTLTGELVRIGHGPHVKATVTVYVRKSSLERLTRYLELRDKGLEKAHDCRDRISTRRARGTMRRSPWDGIF